MKQFRLVVWSLNWVVAIVCAFIGIVSYLDTSGFQWLKLREQGVVGLLLFVVALVTVLLNITYLVVRHVQGYPMRTQVPVKGDDSNITVSLHALRNALIRALKNEPEVHTVDVELAYDRKKKRITKVRAIGTMWDGPEMLRTTMKVQDVLRRRFSDIVAPQEEPKFEVQLESFRFVGKQKLFRERIDRIKETFRGPQYPIGG